MINTTADKRRARLMAGNKIRQAHNKSDAVRRMLKRLNGMG